MRLPVPVWRALPLLRATAPAACCTPLRVHIILLSFLINILGFIAIVFQFLIVFFNLIIFIVSMRENEKAFIKSNENILNEEDIEH